MGDILGTIGGILKLIPGLFSAWEAIKKRWKPSSESLSTPPNSIVERFIALFESHGVRRNQIPLFFGHGLSLASVSNDQHLLSVLTDQALADAAKLFGIHPEWLYGATDQIYRTHDFYKHPERFSIFLKDLISMSGKGALECYAVVTDDIKREHNNGLILIAERIGEVSGRPIFRYHLCDNWNMAYWKSHVDMYACLAIAYQHEIYPQGEVVSKTWMQEHADGRSLFTYSDPYGLDIPGVRRWWPDQVIDMPELFLEGIDNEDRVHSRGHLLAIERWISYCADERLEIYDAELRPKAVQAFESTLDLLAHTSNQAASSPWRRLIALFDWR